MRHAPSILIGLVSCVCSSGPAPVRAAVVTTSEQVHPVLIGKAHNALLRVVVDVQREDEVRLRSMHFDLGGTDDVGDVESLELFTTGDRQRFSPHVAFGHSRPASRQVAFRGDQTLQRGPNVFWLSCRLKPTADLLHRVGASCTVVQTSAGRLLPASSSPPVGHRIGVALRQHNEGGVHTHRLPVLATTPTGTLLCGYDMRWRGAKDMQADIDIGLSRSTDGGRTWEPVRVIVDMGEHGGLPQEQNGCSVPGIVVDQQTGEMFCFTGWMHGKPGLDQWGAGGSEPGHEIGRSAQVLMVRSKDDGRTWSRPENLTRKLKKADWRLLSPAPQQGINLADGTLVLPMEGLAAKGTEFSSIMTSRDHGATWSVASPLSAEAPDRFGGECQAVKLGDGSIMLNMRTEKRIEHERFRAVFVTRDLGRTWRPHETNLNTLIEPHCNASLVRVDYTEAGEPKHVLLFANPHSRKIRTHQTIQVSFDDGRTWPASHHLLLDEGRGWGYASLSQIDDHHVGIAYEGSQADIVFEKVSLEDLLKTR